MQGNRSQSSPIQSQKNADPNQLHVHELAPAFHSPSPLGAFLPLALALALLLPLAFGFGRGFWAEPLGLPPPDPSDFVASVLLVSFRLLVKSLQATDQVASANSP